MSPERPFEPTKKAEPSKKAEPGQKTPRKTMGLTGGLLAAAALHGAVAAAPAAYNEAREVAISVKNRVNNALEQRRLEQERDTMLTEARAAQVEGRPWAGRFLIKNWFIEKRAAHEPYSDEEAILRRYNGLLERLRHTLVHADGRPPTHEQVQQALSRAFEGYDFFISDGHPVDLLREHGGACVSIGLLASALLQDLGLPGVGVRHYTPNPRDTIPVGHIEGTIRMRTATGNVREYGLQGGRPVGTNGVYIRASDFLNYYQRGSINLAFPAPRTAEERRPLPAGGPTIIPFSPGVVAGNASEEADTQQDSEMSSQERQRIIHNIPHRVATIYSFIRWRGVEPPLVVFGEHDAEAPNEQRTPFLATEGYNRSHWSTASEHTQELIRMIAALRTELEQSPMEETLERRLCSVYATLSLLHEQMGLQAATAGRNATARALQGQSREEARHANRAFTSLNTQSTLYEHITAIQQPIIQLLPAARQALLADVQQYVHNPYASNNILGAAQASEGILELSRYAPEPEIRTAALQHLERLLQDPNKRGVLFAYMSHRNTFRNEFVGNHPIVRRYNEFREFVSALYPIEHTVQASLSRQAFESQVETLFHQRFPSRVYDPAYAVAIFVEQALFAAPYHDAGFLAFIRHTMELYQTDPFFSANDLWMMHFHDRINSFSSRATHFQGLSPSAINAVMTRGRVTVQMPGPSHR